MFCSCRGAAVVGSTYRRVCFSRLSLIQRLLQSAQSVRSFFSVYSSIPPFHAPQQLSVSLSLCVSLDSFYRKINNLQGLS
jgi:hypothetical protein